MIGAWKSFKNVKEMIEFLQTIPEETKIEFDIRYVMVSSIEESKIKKILQCNK